MRTLLLLVLAAVLPVVALTPATATAQEDVTAACSGGSADGFPCSSVDLVGHLTTSDLDIATFSGTPRGNDIWGWTDPQTGIEYALVGTTEGTVFVSLDTPTAPQVLGTLRSATSSSTWRDIKTRGNFAYIVSEASGHGMQVFDLTRLRDVTAPPVTFDADARYVGAGSVHNIVIDEALPYAFLVGATQNGFACDGGGLHIVDIGRPTLPRFGGCFDGDGYTHDAQCVRYDGPDTDYTGESICFSSNGSFGSNDILSISNVSDVRNPESISRTTYAFPGYAHQGWLTEDQRYFLMNDEFDESNADYPNSGAGRTRTLIFDVTDLDDPVFVGPFLANVATIDHNLYIRGNYVYQSNYESGLRIYELTDLANAELTLVGSFDTFPSGNRVSYSGQWSNYPFFESGLVIANDQSNGLFVLRSPVISPIANEDTPDEAVAGLSTAYPNPFRAQTMLTLTLDATERVRAEVYDVLGRRVATLFEGTVPGGTPTQLTLDGTRLPVGTYVVRVAGASFAETRRITLAR